MSFRSDLLRRARACCARALLPAALAGAVALLPACSDRSAGPATAPAPAALLPHDAGAGGTSTVAVQVPASMRNAPFDVTRTLTVPSGYGISVYARVGGARFMAITPNGDLLVSNPGAGSVYRVRPGANGADPSVTTWASGLNQPHDIVFHAIGGTMYVYVAETDKIGRYVWDATSATAQNHQVLITGLPNVSDTALHGAYAHQLKNIALGPDDKLYVSIASSCNACVEDTQSNPLRGAIYVYNADGTNRQLFARGIRNAEGLAFVPGTNTLWAVVNNRDNTAYPFHQGFNGDATDDYGKVIPAYVDNHPPDEFIHVTSGANFGWPFCNPDPDAGLDNMPFDRDVQYNADGSRLDCANAATRVNKGIQAHSAALDLLFLTGTKAPTALQGGVAVTLHGSWNRTTPTGYKVVWFPTDPSTGTPGGQEDLVTGWLVGGSAWGRPVGLAVDTAGGVLISDDNSGTIYRLAPLATAAASELIGQQSGLCLDASGGAQTAGTHAIVYTCHAGTNQEWALPASGATGPIHVYGTMCLDDFGGAGKNGDTIGIYTCNGQPNQNWTLTAAGELRGINNKCIDVAGQHTTPGTAVILYTCNGQTNQKWKPQP
ncbi:MAG TPA: ricin-type beta-trefoil lectin domain protein [Gemmatirosa sp.]